MTSRSVLGSLFFTVLLVFFQIAPSNQRRDYGRLNYYRDYDRDYDIHGDKIHVPVPVQKIAKALWDSDYKIMSVLVQLGLQQMLDDCYTLKPKHLKEVELRNISITIFAPQDKSITSAKDVHLHDCVVLLNLDKAAFDAPAHLANHDPFTPTCHRDLFSLYGNLVRLSIPLETVKITRFEIYKDDMVTVHGVDKLLTTGIRLWREQIIPTDFTRATDIAVM